MKLALLLFSLTAITLHVHAQYVYPLKADSVNITNSCDSAELIIQNHTRGVPGGFLYNTGNGRTIFQPALQKLNDSIYLVGPDSLRVTPPGMAAALEGYSADFVYGNGNVGIPSKGSDSIYIDPNLAGKHVQVYVEGPYGNEFLQDSATWALLGAHLQVPYFRFNTSIGQLTFCNFQGITGFVDNKLVIQILAGPQGYGALLDNGTVSH